MMSKDNLRDFIKTLEEEKVIYLIAYTAPGEKTTQIYDNLQGAQLEESDGRTAMLEVLREAWTRDKA